MAQVKTKTSKKRITFRFQAQPGSDVHVAGDFNDWDPSARRMKDKDNSGNYATTMLLPPGEYQYKFVIDGHWSIDPNCDEWVPNAMGSLNSVLKI